MVCLMQAFFALIQRESFTDTEQAKGTSVCPLNIQNPPRLTARARLSIGRCLFSFQIPPHQPDKAPFADCTRNCSSGSSRLMQPGRHTRSLLDFSEITRNPASYS